MPEIEERSRVRGDTASGGVSKVATLETGLEIRVPLVIKEGEKVKVHSETREFVGRRGSHPVCSRAGSTCRTLQFVA